MNDDNLWDQITQTITPLNRDDVLSETSQTEKPAKSVVKRRSPKKTSLSKSAPKKPQISNLTMDRKTWRQIDKGQLPVDGRLDLHGLTVAQAHALFRTYIKDCALAGKQCIIVITGKGDPKKGTGIIRRELPLWAEHKEIAPFIRALSKPSENQGRYILILKRSKK